MRKMPKGASHWTWVMLLFVALIMIAIILYFANNAIYKRFVPVA